VFSRLIGVPPFPAGRVPALEPDLRELTLLLHHGPGRLPGLVGCLGRPRVQEQVRLARGDCHVIAQASAQKIAITGSLYGAPATIDNQAYPPFFGHRGKRMAVSIQGSEDT
jgi:hypothetical protein